MQHKLILGVSLCITISFGLLACGGELAEGEAGLPNLSDDEEVSEQELQTLVDNGLLDTEDLEEDVSAAGCFSRWIGMSRLAPGGKGKCPSKKVNHTMPWGSGGAWIPCRATVISGCWYERGARRRHFKLRCCDVQ